jgi:hypothetical protein
MKEITKYIADDGTEFDDEDECLDYERGRFFRNWHRKGRFRNSKGSFWDS